MSKSLYSILKDIWNVVPQSGRDSLVKYPLGGWIVTRVRSLTVRTAKHEEIYDEKFYDLVDKAACAAAPHMASSMIELFNPMTVIDIGCGTGAFLAELSRQGIDVMGLEYSARGLEMCRARGVPVQPFDLEDKTAVPAVGRFDLATSFEVAEHLPASLAERYVDLLTATSNAVALTAATPGQGGVDHVNEQPHSYWIGKFRDRGYSFLEAESLQVRREWREANMARWYSENILLFRGPG